MTLILEFKNAVKRFYGTFEVVLLPIFKFILAFMYFRWINASMGFMSQLNSIFVVLILALISSVLPSVVMITIGYLMMIMHAYALGIDVAGFFVVMMLIFWIFFLRFSKRQNIVLVFTPLSFYFNVPVLLPIGSGLFGNAIAAIPAACGVVNYYFVRFLKAQAATLISEDMDIVQRIKYLCDGLLQNWPMWISLIAFVVATLLVHMIRSCSFDYSWKIAILAGGIGYVLVILAGSVVFEVNVNMTTLVVYTLASVILGELLELFVFGGAYSRTERLQYEDDDYYYYVKAIPKATISLSERSIKRINDDVDEVEGKNKKEAESDMVTVAQMEGDASGMISSVEVDDVDFEKKLEESLKDL
ncbi:MAG: hypothetical protein Q4B47_03875 [Eubacteriales bacterium]|nr:hypothetical protein [Eubacteriales bacterium]